MVRSIPYACGTAALEFSRPMAATVFPRASSRSRVLFWVIRPSEVMEASVLRRSLLPRLKVDLTCWQDLRARKEKRLEEISARMKSQRLEAEERKKQKEIKMTDRVPPMKRARGCEFYRDGGLTGKSLISAFQGLFPLSRRVCSRRHAVKPRRYRERCLNHACDSQCQRLTRFANAFRVLSHRRPTLPRVLG
jgi:hypothetical protein